MSSLPSRIDEEDHSGAAHVKLKKDDNDTAYHSLTEPKGFIEERMRQADPFHDCAKSIQKFVVHECNTHSVIACSSTAPVYNRCQPVMQYIAAIDRTLVTDCVCA